ncbi:YiiX family permuted papain-like enzyme [Acinetobacter sp. MYb191]|uniref:YiiX family permuted papain-like enzyme n=1 Tax=Acinetobacter sp. MYb191 TaxID=1848593 RepID=UPI0030B50618
MKNRNVVILSAVSLLVSPQQLWANMSYQTGYIIFHVSKSQQSLGIQKATKSRYSHMGLIVHKNGKAWVLEAVQPVKYTALQQWIDRGVERHYVVKRLKTNLTVQQKQTLIKNAEQYLGQPYDLYFEWDNRALYCSEIVWKAYHDALGIELAPLSKLKQFDLSSSEVKQLMQQRYGQNIPLNETVIAPQTIFSSTALVEVDRK